MKACDNCGSGLKTSTCNDCGLVNKATKCGSCGADRNFDFDFCMVCRKAFPDIKEIDFSYDEKPAKSDLPEYQEPITPTITYTDHFEVIKLSNDQEVIDHNKRVLCEFYPNLHKETRELMSDLSPRAVKMQTGPETLDIELATMDEPFATTRDDIFIHKFGNTLYRTKFVINDIRQEMDSVVKRIYSLSCYDYEVLQAPANPKANISNSPHYDTINDIPDVRTALMGFGKALAEGHNMDLVATGKPYVDFDGDVVSPQVAFKEPNQVNTLHKYKKKVRR